MVDIEEQYKGKLYHYTNVEGLKGILENEISFHFTHEEYFNDPEEGKHIETVFEEVLKELLNRNELSTDQIELMKAFKFTRVRNYVYSKETEDEKTDEIDIVGKKQEAFICCFSKLRDSLPMWNYYIKDNSGMGYAIEFDSGIFHGEWSDKPNERINCINPHNLLKKLSKEYGLDTDVKAVIYDDEEKSQIVRDIIRLFVKDYNKSDMVEDLIYEAINDEVNRYRYLFKPKYFKHEEEVRCIVKRDAEESTPKIDIKYRTKAGYLVPYLEIKMDMNKHFLTSVIIGPKSNKEMAESVLKMFLLKNNYNEVKMLKSEIKLSVFG